MARSLLIVDDTPALRHYLARLMRLSGYDVAEASSAAEGLSLLAEGLPLPDLVILDVMMPGRDGLAMLREMRRAAHTARVPVIMWTALDDARRIAAALADGASAYWVKGTTEIDRMLADVIRVIDAGAGAIPPGLGHDPAPVPKRDADPDLV
jgi:DNA-binding response OmpR family regulator